LSCNGTKGDSEVLIWYRRQRFYDPRRAMALKAWMEGDLRLAQRLLVWTTPAVSEVDRLASEPTPARDPHQTRQATSPLWRWQMAS
jgi:hypothetical protein